MNDSQRSFSPRWLSTISSRLMTTGPVGEGTRKNNQPQCCVFCFIPFSELQYYSCLWATHTIQPHSYPCLWASHTIQPHSRPPHCFPLQKGIPHHILTLRTWLSVISVSDHSNVPNPNSVWPGGLGRTGSRCHNFGPFTYRFCLLCRL